MLLFYYRNCVILYCTLTYPSSNPPLCPTAELPGRHQDWRRGQPEEGGSSGSCAGQAVGWAGEPAGRHQARGRPAEEGVRRGAGRGAGGEEAQR